MIWWIDPGVTGGIAFYNGLELYAHRVPTSKLANKKILIWKVFANCCMNLTWFIEQQQAMPRQGVASTLRQGLAMESTLAYCMHLAIATQSSSHANGSQTWAYLAIRIWPGNEQLISCQWERAAGPANAKTVLPRHR